MFKVGGAGVTSAGLDRSTNDDHFLVADGLPLFLVADGMSGHPGGHLAARMSAEIVEEAIRSDWPELERLHQKGQLSREDREKVLSVLDASVATACRRIYEHGQRSPEVAGLGCTLTAMLTVGDRGFVAHVGDSRLYLFRSGELNALTRDHRVLDEMLRSGRVSHAEAKEERYKDGLSRALGVQPSVQADLLDLEIMLGDRFLICSDGLHAYVERDELMRTLASVSVGHPPTQMLGLAESVGAPDNVSAVVVEVRPPAPLSAPPVGMQTATDQISLTDFQTKMEALDEVPLFKNLSYQERVSFLAATDERPYAPGSALMAEGEPASHFYVLVKGQCEVRKGQTVIAELGPGSPIGDIALVNRSLRTATVVAKQEVVALVIDRDSFFQFLRSDPVVATKVLWNLVQVLSTRLAQTSSELSDVRAESGPTEPEFPIFSKE